MSFLRRFRFTHFIVTSSTGAVRCFPSWAVRKWRSAFVANKLLSVSGEKIHCYAGSRQFQNLKIEIAKKICNFEQKTGYRHGHCNHMYRIKSFAIGSTHFFNKTKCHDFQFNIQAWYGIVTWPLGPNHVADV